MQGRHWEPLEKIHGINYGEDACMQVPLGDDLVEAQTNAGTRQPREKYRYRQPPAWSSMHALAGYQEQLSGR